MKDKESCSEFIAHLEQATENPLHKRIICVYLKERSVKAMEDELSEALRKVVNRED